jgi:hypothetical protein
MNQPATTTPRRNVGVSTGHNIRVEQSFFWERKLVGNQQLAIGSPAPSAAT